MKISPRSRFMLGAVTLTTFFACHSDLRAPAETVAAAPASAPNVEPALPLASPTTSATPRIVRAWDLAAASRHLDERVTEWMDHTPQVGNNFACAMACHTALTFAATRVDLANDDPVATRLRSRVHQRVGSAATFHAATPFYGAAGSRKSAESLSTEAVLNAATLAMLDHGAASAGPETLKAFEHMWEMQRADGGFDWLDFKLEPWEAGDGLFGAALAARAVSALPATDAARFAAQVARLVAFVRGRAFDDDVPLFAKATVLWGTRALKGLDALPEVEPTREAIARRQNDDGGFSWAGMGIIGARDKDKGGLSMSDSLPTAIAILGMCAARDTTANVDRARAKALDWLVRQQLTDGTFPAKSPNRDRAFSHLVMTDAATAYATLALSRECE